MRRRGAGPSRAADLAASGHASVGRLPSAMRSGANHRQGESPPSRAPQGPGKGCPSGPPRPRHAEESERLVAGVLELVSLVGGDFASRLTIRRPSGGLLIALAADHAGRLLDDLYAQGLTSARCVGRVGTRREHWVELVEQRSLRSSDDRRGARSERADRAVAFRLRGLPRTGPHCGAGRRDLRARRHVGGRSRHGHRQVARVSRA